MPPIYRSLIVVFLLALSLGLISTFSPSQVNAATYTIYPSGGGSYQSYTLPSSGDWSAYDTSSGSWECSGSYTDPSLSACQAAGQAYSNTCCASSSGCTTADGTTIGIWGFRYASGCKITLRSFQGDCTLGYSYQTQDCAIVDRCDTGYASGTDYKVYAGQCNAARYNGNPNQPETACVTGGWYKSCCTGAETSSSGPLGHCNVIPYTRTCDVGSVTPAGQTSCYVAPPICTSNGLCNAPTPSCGTTTSGIDNCNNPCSRQGPACEPTPIVCDPYSQGPICDTAYCSSDGSVCAQGHQYCLWDGSDYGPCSEEINNCASQCTITPKPTPGPSAPPPPPPSPKPLPDLTCNEFASADGGNTWSKTVSAGAGQQVKFKMEIGNQGNGIDWFALRNYFQPVVDGFTNIEQNAQANVFWLIYRADMPPGSGIYYDSNYQDYGGFNTGQVDTTPWSAIINPGARTFKNTGFAAYSGIAQPWQFGGNFNDRCWQDPQSGGPTCLQIVPASDGGRCNLAWEWCPYNMSFQCNRVTVITDTCDKSHNRIDSPANNATFTIGSTYTIRGWGTFCSGPNNTNRVRVDLHLCDRGTFNNCRAIGSATAQVRQDVVDNNSTCGSLNPNADGWTFSWTPTSSFLGNKTLRVASINDAAVSCVAWDERDITITAPVPTPRISANQACTAANTAGMYGISWTNIPGAPPVSYVDLSTDNFPNTSAATWYHKDVSGGTSTSASAGFNGFRNGNGPLTFQPNTTYYVRLWNGSANSAIVSFTTPQVCRPEGNLDTVDCLSFTGWACDGDNYNRPIDVHFYADNNQWLGSTQANQNRPDPAWGNTCGGNRVHGFTFTVPDSLKNSQNHQIYTYGINIPGSPGNNTQLNNSPKTLNCSAGAVSKDVSGPGTTCNGNIPYLGNQASYAGWDNQCGGRIQRGNNGVGQGCCELGCGADADCDEQTANQGSCNAQCAATSPGANTPWIQTTGGDVHSNTRINTPGGP